MTVLTTFAAFAGSFAYATANPFTSNAPLQPAVVDDAPGIQASATATQTPVTSTTITTTVRTTTRAAVTSTRSS